MKISVAFALAAFPSSLLTHVGSAGSLRMSAIAEADERRSDGETATTPAEYAADVDRGVIRRMEPDGHPTSTDSLVNRHVAETPTIDSSEHRRLLGCVNVRAYQVSPLSDAQVSRIQAAIAAANGATLPTNLCFTGAISGESNLGPAVSSGTIDLLIAFNNLNDFPVWSDASKTIVQNALNAGKLKKLMVYDRFANNDVKFPGLAAGSVFREFDVEPVEPIDSSVSPNVGPSGTVGTWSGCFSNHGYISPVGTLERSKIHFRRQPDSKAISIQFCYNTSLLYYSTTPEDIYLNGFICETPNAGSANKLFANTLYKIAAESCCSRNVGVFSSNSLTGAQADTLFAAINVANSGSPSANLCWDGVIISNFVDLISAVNSGTIDLLLAFNTVNTIPIWPDSTFVADALTSGKLKKLMVFDRFARIDVKVPGLPAGSVVRSLNFNPVVPINASDSPNVGPAGTVGSWIGCNSNHGYLAPTAGTLPEAEFHFRRQPDSNPVSVQFCYNQSLIYYSTTPEDFYLSGTCPSPNQNAQANANKLLANTLWKIATESCSVLTSAPSKAPTEAPTRVPTKAPTDAPTKVSTESPTSRVTKYYLWNAANDTLVGSFSDGGSYCINFPYNIEVRPAYVTLPVGLKIWPQGGSTIARQKEYEAPYYLWGNLDSNVLPNNKPLPTGVYHVSDLSGGDKITFTQTCSV